MKIIQSMLVSLLISTPLCATMEHFHATKAGPRYAKSTQTSGWVVKWRTHTGRYGSRHGNAPTVHPALWKATGSVGTIYLFGTIHALPAGLGWRTPAFIKAEEASSGLVLEIGNLDDKAAVAQAFQSAATAPNLPDVLDRVPADKRAGLKALFDKAGIPIAGLKGLKTWAVTFALVPLMLKDMGIDPSTGVEAHVAFDFKTAHKPIEGVETAAQQFGVFDHLSEAAQRELLLSAVDDEATAKADFETMLAAWKIGDEKAIAANFDKDIQSQPELSRALIHNRNAAWTTWLLARLAKPGVTFMAVGAGHLAGNDSVIAMLRAKGVKVERVQ